MNNRLRKFGVYLSAGLVRRLPQALRGTGKMLVILSAVIIVPARFIYKKVLFPVLVLGYKLYIVFGERLRTFFYAQHKILAILSHRFAIHGVMLVATIAMITANVVQASNSQPLDVFSDSLINDYLGQSRDTVITADTPLNTTYRYIPMSSSSRIDQFTLGGDIDNNSNLTSGGTAISKTSITQNSKNSDEVQTYVVEGGDTISSIAAAFGVSIQTVLWANDLSATSTIKPGQQLKILPTTGLTYTIAKGDTISSIASKYKANADEIVTFNNLISGDNLPTGTTIIIPNGQKEIPVQVATTSRSTSRTSSYTKSSGYVPASSSVSGGRLQWPTTAKSITCYFTYCYGGVFHTGIDIDGRTGDPIWAAESGTVTQVQYSNRGYGINIYIQHDNGIVTHYAHLSRVYVSVGQRVSRGQTIAAEGNTGFSSGDHLHFEVIVGGRFQNPLNYVQR
ncbi:MAG: M23 family metallopeptidase [Candidatus Kerfeldbacteria bacterium]|nr:M23 family metallopeptidase [Candidatus Kerfeldbacteria bacterium]